MANEYDIGDLVRVKATFTNENSVAENPSAITAYYKTPSGVLTTLIYNTDVELEKEDVGIYFVEIDITESGNWHYRFEGSGTIQAAEEAYFKVIRSNIV